MKKRRAGNFPSSMPDPESQSIFEPYGTVESAKIVQKPWYPVFNFTAVDHNDFAELERPDAGRLVDPE